MLYSSISITNPLVKRDYKNNCLLSKAFFLTKRKTLEIQINGLDLKEIVDISFNIRTNQCHSGFDLTLGLFGAKLIVQFYDNRHWNYGENRYYRDGESED